MQIDPTQVSPRDIYRHMVSCITPRPIAWVSTISERGITNLAPFSFFNGVCPNPPTVMFCPTTKRDGTEKDTLVNIRATKEFVVNIVSDRVSEKMNETSAELPFEESEFVACGLVPIPSVNVRPPRVAGSLVQLECKLHQIVDIGTGPLSGHIVIGTIVMLHASDDVLDAEGQIDPAKLDTVGRMGGVLYTYTRERFELDRP